MYDGNTEMYDEVNEIVNGMFCDNADIIESIVNMEIEDYGQITIDSVKISRDYDNKGKMIINSDDVQNSFLITNRNDDIVVKNVNVVGKMWSSVEGLYDYDMKSVRDFATLMDRLRTSFDLIKEVVGE